MEEQNLSTFVGNVIEEYKDGRINTSYLMLKYLNQIKERAAAAEI